MHTTLKATLGVLTISIVWTVSSHVGISQSKRFIETNGPFGGLVYHLASNNNDEVIASGYSSVFYSSDRGNSWSRIANSFGGECVITDQGRIFVAEGTLKFTTDYGVAWQTITSNSFRGTIRRITQAPNGDLIVAADNGSPRAWVLRSSDDGATWIDLGIDSMMHVRTIGITSKGSILVSGYFDEKGWVLLKTTDNGSTWTNSLKIYDGSVIQIASNRNGDLYASLSLYEKSGYEKGLYVFKSTNDGETWIQYSAPWSYGWLFALHASIDGEVYVGTYRGLFQHDGSGRWSGQLIRGYPWIPLDMISLQSGELLCGLQGGVFRSSNRGVTWDYAIESFKGSYCRTMLADGNRIIVGTKHNGIIFPEDLGTSWTRMTADSIRGIESILRHPDGSMYSLTEEYGLLVSSDNGSRWHVLKTMPPERKFGTLTISRNGNIFLGSKTDVADQQATVLRSTDSGTTWTDHESGLGRMSIACLFSDSRGWIYAGSDYQRGLYRSTNDGDTWSLITPEQTTAYSVAEAVNGALLIGSWDGILISEDTGSTWKRAAWFNNIRVISVRRDAVLFAGSDYGLFTSTDNGKSWMQLPFAGEATSIAFDLDENPYIGTYGRGVWRSTSDDGKPAVPLLFSPSNHSTIRSKTDTLRWENVLSARFYTVEVSLDSLFDELPFGTVSTTRTILPFKVIDDHLQYFWRVKAINDFGQSPWSEVWSFVSKDERIKPPSRFFVSVGFPLPASGTAQFDLEHPTNEIPQMHIYNTLGQRQSVGIDRFNISHGIWRIRINTEMLSSGLHLARFVVSGDTELKRLLILK